LVVVGHSAVEMVHHRRVFGLAVMVEAIRVMRVLCMNCYDWEQAGEEVEEGLLKVKLALPREWLLE
jgi:hypothetical protein